MSNKIKQVTIMLTMPRTLVSSVIRLYTRGPYTHVSLGMDLELSEVYSFSRKKLYTPFIGGFMKEDIHSGIYGLYRSTQCAVYAVELSEAQYDKLRNLIATFIKDQSKYKYNYLGLLGVVKHNPHTSTHRFFCSEFVAYLFEEIGIKVTNKHPALSLPGDFLRNPKIKLIYEGKLCDYNLNRLKTNKNDCIMACNTNSLILNAVH